MGDKSDYDSTLRGLEREIGGPEPPEFEGLYEDAKNFEEKMQAEMQEKPLEKVMKDALNYDSTLYK